MRERPTAARWVVCMLVAAGATLVAVTFAYVVLAVRGGSTAAEVGQAALILPLMQAPLTIWYYWYLALPVILVVGSVAAWRTDQSTRERRRRWRWLSIPVAAALAVPGAWTVLTGVIGLVYALSHVGSA